LLCNSGLTALDPTKTCPVDYGTGFLYLYPDIFPEFGLLVQVRITYAGFYAQGYNLGLIFLFLLHRA